MSEGTEFLTYVREKIRLRLDELSLTISAGKEDIHRMNDYFWENYTEMDEYGYEDYDNQQVLLRQSDINREHKMDYMHLTKMLDAPFFGAVRFLYDGDDEPEMFYIGIASFSPNAGDVPLIYDWRAPVSGLFYDYDAGPAFYEAPMGILSGNILGKYQYKIRDGRMVYEFENDTKIDDEILKMALGANSSTSLKNIIRTIQKEQNKIIRNTKDRVMIIQGAAGSGKTSIALHRIAYLLYHDRKHLSSSQVLILSPNSVFSDYISHILPELGEEKIQEMTLDIFAWHQLRMLSGDCEDRYHQMERMMHQDARPAGRRAINRYRFKQSKKFTDIMDRFIEKLPERIVGIHDVTFKKKRKKKLSHDLKDLTITAEEISTLFFDKFASLPLLSRMDAVADKFIDDFETLFGDIIQEDADLLRAAFRDMYATRDIYEIYGWLLEEQHMPQLPEMEVQDRMLRYEDVYPMLYMKCRLMTMPQGRPVRHLIIDEMQDYSYLQFRILNLLFTCSRTILGDFAQALEPGQPDTLSFLPEMLGDNCRVIRLNKSYRNTREIAAFAERFCRVEAIDYFDRHGKPVTEKECTGLIEAADDACSFLHTEEGSYETAAILAMNEADAKAVYDHLRNSGIKASFLDRDSMTFSKGLTVTTWYMAKGLEFDQVFIMPADTESSFYEQYVYIAATRALHELYVYNLRK